MHIASDATIVTHPSFERGVVKLLRGEEERLTRDEKRALTALMKPGETGINTTDNDERIAPAILMAGRLSKRRNIQQCSSRYIDPSFMLGSVVGAERLWSVAKKILTDNRQLMPPQLFEAFLFIKVNDRFWYALIVSAAYKSMNRGTNGESET